MHHQPITSNVEPCDCSYCRPRLRDRYDLAGLAVVGTLGGIWAFCVITALAHIHQVGF